MKQSQIALNILCLKSSKINNTNRALFDFWLVNNLYYIIKK